MAIANWLESRTPRALGGPIRLRTLILIRWVAITGQLVSLLAVHFTLGFELPLLPTLGAVALSALVNLLSTVLWPPQTRLGDTGAALYLGYDVIQLSVLLALTGGLQNPFAFLFVVPVTVAATILSLRSTMALCGLALICISLVSVFHWPLPWAGATLLLPALYLTGTWAALVLGTVFIAAYTFRVSAEARAMVDAYGALQAALAREQRVSALGALAAAAAHELGTPLSTILLVTKEIARDLPADSPLGDDVRLLVEQTGRCREILGRLSGLSQGALDSPYGRLPISALAEAAAAPLRTRERGVRIVPEPLDGSPAREPEIARRAEIMHGLGNLIENAVEFSRQAVEVRVRWSEKQVAIDVLDDGPGFPPGLLAELGEPYLSTRRDEGRLGLGLFIAKTLLERTGARVAFHNRQGGGAQVSVEWPRAILESLPTEGALRPVDMGRP